LTAAWRLTTDAREFDAAAGGFVAGALERNVMATVFADTLAGTYEHTLFAYALDDDAVVAAALRTAPWPLLVDGVDAELAAALLTQWLRLDPDLPGVGGPAASARLLAAAWVDATGGSRRLAMREAMHQLEQVTAPQRLAPGTLRRAEREDFDLLVAWEAAFRIEAGVAVSGEEVEIVRRRMARGGHFVWEDGGTPVAMVGRSRIVAGVARIGPVYTPPERRNRGYASAAVAAVSQAALDGDADRCMLLTDLENPTSNRIYAALGYRRFADWEDYHFSQD
jgi:RimJ/RimL family protein N-acetyltransferase